MASFTPYISEFEYSPEFHPSRNPSCPKRWARGVWDERRSPEEGGPVGQEPSIEIRAVLVRCPKSHEEMTDVPIGTGNIYNITAGRSQDILEFHGFDRDEPAHHSEVKKCRRKLIVTMKFNNIGKTKTQEEFVVVDHVLDPVTMRKARLLNPFVFKVRQEQVLQLYGLKFQSVVNAEAKEEVINKKSSNYTGCEDSLVNPTCGQMMFQGKPIPFSQGFCCSCDPDVNLARQPADKKSEALSLGNLQRIMPDRNEKDRDTFSPLFEGRKNSAEEPEPSFEENSKSYAESLRNPAERSLKSSQISAGVSNSDGEPIVRQNLLQGEDRLEFFKREGAKDIISNKNENENNFHEDYPSAEDFSGSDVSSALRAALSQQNPSRGKIEPYMDAVRNEALMLEQSQGRSNVKENLDEDIFREFKQSESQKFRDRKPSEENNRDSVSKIPDSELTAELVELEKEYETLKKSRKKVEEREAEIIGSNFGVFGNHSKCKDFRKLARDRDRHSSGVKELENVRKNGSDSSNYNVKRGSVKGLDDKLPSSLFGLEKNNSVDKIGNKIRQISSSSSSSRENKMPSTSYSLALSSLTKTSREKLYSTSTNPNAITKSNLSPRFSSSITTIPSNDTKSISTLASTTYPTLILRQELVNDKLYYPSILGDIVTAEPPFNDTENLLKSAITNPQLVEDDRSSAFSKNFERKKMKDSLENSRDSSYSETTAAFEEQRKTTKPEEARSKNLTKDQYADWVIKYGKMHNNHYINSELEEPVRKYDLDLDSESSTDAELLGGSKDVLGNIADKVLKEFESAENEASFGHEGVEEEVLKQPIAVAPGSVQTLNNPEITAGSFENLGNPHFSSAIARNAEEFGRGEEQSSDNLKRAENAEKESRSDLEKENTPLKKRGNSSNTRKEFLTSKIKDDPNEVKLSDKLLKKSNEYNSTIDGSLAKIGNHHEEAGQKTIEPAAVIVPGSGDMVKGDFRYQDRSATVIADRRLDEPQFSTDHDYVFLDKNGREESHDISSLTNFREYSKSNVSNNSGLHSMGRKIKEALLGDNENTGNEAVDEKWNRLDDLLKGSIRSRRRSFRSISYDDPFHRGNDEKQAKIDQKIEKEFAEITEALNESSDSQKNGAKLLPIKQTDSSKDIMLRDLAVMLNENPENYELKNAGKIEYAENGIGKFRDSEMAGNRQDRHSGRKRFTSTSKKRKRGNKHLRTFTKIKANEIEVEKFSPIKEELGKPEVLLGREIGYVIPNDEELLSKFKNASGIHESVIERPRYSNHAVVRSSTSKYTGAESQTNINEIVKEIIKNDYRPSSSWNREQKHSGRRKNIAVTKAFDVTSSKPDSIFSLKSILHGLHIGKLKKKCHEGTSAPLIHNNEKDAEQSLPPDESTVMTTSAEHEVPKTSLAEVTEARTHELDPENNGSVSENVFDKLESTLPKEETTLVSKNEFGTTTVAPIIVNFGTSTFSMEKTSPTENSQTTSPSIAVDVSTRMSTVEETASTSIPRSTETQIPEETNHPESSSTEMVETGISNLSQELTTTTSTHLTSNHENGESRMNHEETRRLSSYDIINGLEKFSNQLREEKLHEFNPEIADSADHASKLKRSPIDSESEENDERDATTWMQNDEDGGAISTQQSSDDEKDKLKAENLELKKELNDALGTNNNNNNSNGETTEHQETSNEMLPTTYAYDETSDEENDSEDDEETDDEETTSGLKNDELLTVYQETTSADGMNNDSSTVDEETTSDRGNEAALTVFQETTISGEKSTNGQEETIARRESTALENVTAFPEEFSTPSLRTTSGENPEEHFTAETEFSKEELSTESQKPTTSEIGITTSAVSGGFPNPQTPKGFGEILRLNNPGGSSVLLVKTYSVSKNPKEFLDNYEFPVEVKKVLLKRLNTTALIDDPVNFETSGESLLQKVNKLVIKENEDADDSDMIKNVIQGPRTVAKVEDLSFVGSEGNDDIDGREKSSKDKILGTNDAGNFSSRINRRAIHEPNIDDLKLQQFQQDSYKNVQFNQHNKKEKEGDNGAEDFDLTMNGVEEKPDRTGFSNNEFLRNYGLKVTRSFTTPDTLPPDDKTTHFSFDDDVNATELFRPNYVMEEPIFPHEAKIKNRNFNQIEFFYDYDSDLNENDMNRFYRSSNQNDGRIIKNLEKNVDHEELGKKGYRRLKKREVTEDSKDFGNRGVSCTGEPAKADKIPEIIPREENHEVEIGTQTKCSDGKWQGKMDFLKLKKHQDILKEYLNWSPNVETTVMRIFSIYSTSGVSRTTTENYLGKDKNLQDTSTMSILLIENGADEKAEETNQRSSSGLKTNQLNDEDILNKLSKTPIDDNLMIISVMEKKKKTKNELDMTNESLGRKIEKPKRSGKRKHRRAKSVSSKAGENGRRRRNINFSSREARNTSSWKGRSGRRLMSAVHLSENKDNGLWDEETVPEEKEEVVGKEEELPEYEDLVPKGDISRFEYLDSSYKKHKRDKLKSNWDHLVDKIIVNNNNNENNNNPSGRKRNSNKQLDELPLEKVKGKEKSVMEKLHFFDADKYIKLMAKKINRLSNVDNNEQDLTAEKENKVVNNSEKSLGRSKYFNEINSKTVNDASAFADDDKNRIFEEEIPYEDGSRSVENSPVGQSPFFGKLGNDFEISISGKVHINGESDNQPMSISIEGMSVDNVTSNKIRDNSPSSFSQNFETGRNRNESDFRIKQADNIYFDNADLGGFLKDKIPANNYNKKQKFFGEAGAAVSQNLTPIQQNPDLLLGEKSEASRVASSPRKTFYNVVVRAHPRYQKWPIKSTRDFTGADESSEDFSDDAEAEERRDPLENDPERSGEHLTADQPVFDFAKLELRYQKPPGQNEFEEETLPVFNQVAEEPLLDDARMEDSHIRRRNARRLRQENTPDIKLVKLIPVDPFNGDEEEQRSLVERKPADLITSELPKMEFEPSSTMSGAKRTRIKPVRRIFNNSHLKSMVSNENTDAKSRVRSIDEAVNVSEVKDDSLVKKSPENLEEIRFHHHNERLKPRRTTSELLKSVFEKASKNSNLFDRKKSLDTRESEGSKSNKTRMYTSISPKYVSNIAEPCYGEKQITSVSDEPSNLTVKSLSHALPIVINFPADGKAKKLREEEKEVRLSTDDLLLPASKTLSKNGEILIKGVKISSPGENPHDFIEREDDSVAKACGEEEPEVNSRKTIQLKNLMTMMNFIKKLEDILPGSDDEDEILDESPDPETVVEVKSVLLLPKESSGIQTDGDDEIKQVQTTSERVVEIGEGVKHNELQRHRTKEKNPGIVVLGNPTGIESLSLGKDVDKNFNRGGSMSQMTSGKDKNKSLMFKDQAISEPGISGTDSRFEIPKSYETLEDVMKNVGVSQDETKVKNATEMKALFKKVENKIQRRLSELNNNSSSDKRSSEEFPPVISAIEKNLSGSRNASNVNKRNLHQGNLRTRSNVDEDVQVHSDDVLNLILEDRLQGKSNRGLSPRKITENEAKGFGFKEQNGLPEIVVRPVKFDGTSSKPKKIENILIEEEGHQLDRQARTPVTYAVGVSEMGAKKLKVTDDKQASVENGMVIQKKKRRTRNLGRSKMVDSKNRKKRKHKKRKKKKKKKKKKKWWPFKRNLLAVFEEQESRFEKNQDERSMNSISEWRSKKSKNRKKRQIKAGGTQIRGGQDCMDRRHPQHVNSAKYQESAHCLRFSDLWYSVYELETPIMEHTVYLQLFEKHTLPDGTTHWDDLTQGSMIRLGTFVRHQRDSAPTISFTYSGAKVAAQKQARNLNPAKDRLLVPSPVASEKLAKYPEVKGGSGEYLVVESNAINKDGNDCDKAGVGFSTFATQPNRCAHAKGTCLKNQPLAYWRHDVEAREAGRPGCYFLSNFASVPNNPIKYNVSGSGSREYLGLEYHSTHVSAIDIEVRADYNAIVRVGSSGRVTEVYVDSTAPEHTVVTIVISNMGLASSPYQSRISDCPTGLPVSWTKAKGAMQVVPPQHDQRVTLDLYGQLFVNDFHCSVEVVNHRGELVAMRRIRVQKMDRCFCVWHCLCACVGSVAGLGCQPMSPEHYHAAGFQGPVPVVSMENSVMANTIKDVMMISGIVVLILLGLGMLKWLIGIFYPIIARWGLDVLLAGSQMAGYFEAELRCRSIMKDFDGKIVHPDTGKRSVRICSRRSEFFLNLIFFLTYPIAMCCNCARNSLANKNRNCCQDESKVCLLKDEGTPGYPNLICVNTYGDSRNSKMEAEDTRFVINELKRSRDSLQDGIGKRCKNCSESLSPQTSSKNLDRKENSARQFVAELIKTRVVFRNLKKTIGGIDVPENTEYSLRGYFMNAENGGYRFITPCPFKQHWLIDSNDMKKSLKPAKIYPSNKFMVTFTGAEEVYESEEISVKPKGICINVQFLNEE